MCRVRRERYSERGLLRARERVVCLLFLVGLSHVRARRVSGAYAYATSPLALGCGQTSGGGVWWRNPSGDRGKYEEQRSGDVRG
ncbi:hypothetical protein C8Q80DRAFT_1168116 [Daedaleopsis nitida]|nr:hypothetical protein C8Q80DRAFT_1168116 [Daedaleopsis nitida]